MKKTDYAHLYTYAIEEAEKSRERGEFKECDCGSDSPYADHHRPCCAWVHWIDECFERAAARDDC